MRFAVRLITLLAGLCVLGGTTQAEPQKRLGEYCLTHIFTPDFDHQLDFHVTGIVDLLATAPYAQAAVREALGEAKGHLENLQELAAEPAGV